MCVSGLCTRVRGTARVCGMLWQTPRRAPRLCRVGRGRDSQETAAQRSVFSPGGVRRASAQESPCQTPGVGRHKWQLGVGSRCLLGKMDAGARHSRRAEQRDLTEFPCHKNTVRHTHHTRACKCVWRAARTHRTGCARACATARHTHR